MDRRLWAPWPASLPLRGFSARVSWLHREENENQPSLGRAETLVSIYSRPCAATAATVSSNANLAIGRSCVASFPRWQGTSAELRSPASPGMSPPALGGSRARKPMEAASRGGSRAPLWSLPLTGTNGWLVAGHRSACPFPRVVTALGSER